MFGLRWAEASVLQKEKVWRPSIRPPQGPSASSSPAPFSTIRGGTWCIMALSTGLTRPQRGAPPRRRRVPSGARDRAWDRRVAELAEAFLFAGGDEAVGAHGRRLPAGPRRHRDVDRRGRGRRAAEPRLSQLTKPALRRRSPPGRPATPGRRCSGPWRAWNRFFCWLVAEDLVEGNPMDGVDKPKPTRAGSR